MEHGTDPLKIIAKGQETILNRICSHGNLEMLKVLAVKKIELDFIKENDHGKGALKAFIGRKTKPKPSRFFYHDICPGKEKSNKPIEAEEYITMIKYVLQSTRKTLILDESVDVFSLIVKAIEDEKCLITQEMVEKLFFEMSKSRLKHFTAESMILDAQKGLVQIIKYLNNCGVPADTVDIHGKTAFVYLLEKVETFTEVAGFAGEVDFRSYLMSSSGKNIKIVREWIENEPELDVIFGEHYSSIGWDKMLELFTGDFCTNILSCFEHFIQKLLQNKFFFEKLLTLVLTSPKIDFKAFIDKLIAAKEVDLLRDLVNRAELLLQKAIVSHNTNAALFIISSWHVSVTAQLEGQVPLYLVAEKANCDTLQKLLDFSKPDFYDEAVHARSLRHSPCTCIDKNVSSFNFISKIGEYTAIDIYKMHRLTELVNKLSPAEAETAVIDSKRPRAAGGSSIEIDVASQAELLKDKETIKEILSGKNNNWKQLKSIIRDQSELFLRVCFEIQPDRFAPINAAKTSKFRLIKLFSSLTKYAKEPFFERFVAEFDACFPGLFKKFIKRFGAYSLVCSRKFVMTYFLVSKYKIPIDARVFTFQFSSARPQKRIQLHKCSVPG